MSLPTPKDGDRQADAPGGPSERQARQAEGKEEWRAVPDKPGFFINSAGRLKYDPFLDPSHPLYRAAAGWYGDDLEGLTDWPYL